MKNIIFKLLKPIAFLIREFFQKDKVTIVLFHNTSYMYTKRLYKFYSKYYHLITLDTYIKAKETKQLNRLPKKALIITFDDGWKENYKLLPIFKEYKIPPTIFITTGLIDTNKRFLSSKNILEMKEFVDFQSHTVLHPNMLKTKTKVLEKELIDSKNYLENLLNKKINSFAYPFGKYNEKIIELVKFVGYQHALTVDLGFNSYEDNFLLKRICISDTPSEDELYVKSTGLWEFIKRASKRKRNENPSLL